MNTTIRPAGGLCLPDKCRVTLLALGDVGSTLLMGLRLLGGDPEGKLRLLLDYTDDPHDIEDPWYSGDFEKAYREIREGCTGYLKQFRVK